MGVGTAKIDNLWQVHELWHHSDTETSPCTVRKQIFPEQHFNNTDNKCNPSDTTEPRLEQVSTPRGGNGVLGEQRTCTTCRVNGEWTLPATKSCLIQTHVRKRLFKNCSRGDTDLT